MKLLTRTQVVISIAWIVPIDIQLAIIVPVHIRHITIIIARTRLLPDPIHFTENFLQNFLRLSDSVSEFFMKHPVKRKSSPKPDKQFPFLIGKSISRQARPIVLAASILA